jgi:hypothetical protein
VLLMVCAVSKNVVCAAIFALCTHSVFGVCSKVCARCIGHFEPYLGCIHLVCAAHVLNKYVLV